MKPQAEVELKFLVPAGSLAALAREMARGAAVPEHSALAARYLDTPDRRLARAGLAWRLRREGRGWVQTLKAGGPHALERFEHEVIRPDGNPDASPHAGTAAGDRLLALLRRAQTAGSGPVVRFQTDVRRTTRRIRTRGAVVEVALDQGRLLAGPAAERICEVEFELCTGSAAALLALAERWRKRFGLVYDPRSKAERGDRLAQGSPHPPVRKAAPIAYARHASAREACVVVLDECLAQLTRNAIGLCAGDPLLRVEHVHQLRVGIRRLRSALRSFAGWVPEPPIALIDALRALFAALGPWRDADVMAGGVAAGLAQAGAPPLRLPPVAAAPDVVALITAAPTQQTLLGWITWHTGLAEPPGKAAAGAAAAGSVAPATTGAAAAEQAAAPGLPRRAERRLRRWHDRVVADADAFDTLDEQALHALRKRIKRLRYAVEFFTPLLRTGQVRRYLRVLAPAQDQMGALNDLLVARSRYQALVEADPAAWFALGWLAARIGEARSVARATLARLAKADPPTA